MPRRRALALRSNLARARASTVECTWDARMATSSSIDSSELVRRALSAVATDECLTVDSRRAKRFQKMGKEFIDMCTSREHSWHFKTFSDELVQKERELFVTAVGRCRLASSKRARLWTSFHNLATNDLPKIWTGFFNSIRQPTQADCDTQSNTLFQQSVNQKVFECLMQDYFAVTEPDPTSEVVLGHGKDEHNAVRYAAGFVPHILLKRYEQKTDKKSSQYVQCLGNMAVVSSHTDFL